MMSNKNKSIQVLTKGVEFLFKKNKVTYIKGKGVLFSKNDIIVYDNNKEHKITPKQGRVVIFNGLLRHTATQPINGSRCIINVNIC